MAENRCKWQAVYKKFRRWAKNGVMQRIFATLQTEKIIAVKVEVLALDGTSCKGYPDAHGVLKNSKNRLLENQEAVGIPSFMWYPQRTFPEENVTPQKDALR